MRVWISHKYEVEETNEIERMDFSLSLSLFRGRELGDIEETDVRGEV